MALKHARGYTFSLSRNCEIIQRLSIGISNDLFPKLSRVKSFRASKNACNVENPKTLSIFSLQLNGNNSKTPNNAETVIRKNHKLNVSINKTNDQPSVDNGVQKHITTASVSRQINVDTTTPAIVRYKSNLQASSPNAQVLKIENERTVDAQTHLARIDRDDMWENMDQYEVCLDDSCDPVSNDRSVQSIKVITRIKISPKTDPVSPDQSQRTVSTLPLGASANSPLNNPHQTFNGARGNKLQPTGLSKLESEKSMQDGTKVNSRSAASAVTNLDAKSGIENQKAIEQSLSKKIIGNTSKYKQATTNQITKSGSTPASTGKLQNPIEKTEKVNRNTMKQVTGESGKRQQANAYKNYTLTNVTPHIKQNKSQPNATTSKQSDLAKIEIGSLRSSLVSICRDLEQIQSSLVVRDFSHCAKVAETVRKFSTRLAELIPHLGYSPFEKDLWEAHHGIESILENVKTQPAMIIMHLVELGFYIFEIGNLLGIQMLPACFAEMVHSIYSRVHRLSVGRVVRQIIYVPVIFDSIVGTYYKDKRIGRIEHFCGCRLRLLEPSHPQAQYCPPEFRTLQVDFDPERGKHLGLPALLNRCIDTKNSYVRVAITVLRRTNGTEIPLMGRDLVDLQFTESRPRLQEVRGDISASLKSPAKQTKMRETENTLLSKSALLQ